MDRDMVLQGLRRERQAFQRMCDKWLRDLAALEGSHAARPPAFPPADLAPCAPECEASGTEESMSLRGLSAESLLDKDTQQRHNGDLTIPVRPSTPSTARSCNVTTLPHVPMPQDFTFDERSHDKSAGAAEDRATRKPSQRKVSCRELERAEETETPWRSAARERAKMMRSTASTVTFALQVRGKAATQNGMYRFSQGSLFQAMSYLVVAANAIQIGASAQINLQSSITGSPDNPIVASIDIAFLAWFLLELSVRAAGERLDFLVGENKGWNFLDSVVVLLSLIDQAATSSGSLDVSSARMLRLSRFMRFFRMLRAVKAFTSLRVIVLSILDSALPLFWCFTIVGFIIYAFSVFFMQCSIEYFRSQADEKNSAVWTDLETYFGSLRQAMATLFQSISGGVNWMDAMKPLVEVHWAYEYVFTFYVFFMYFAVLNVVIGTFVSTTADVQEKDRDTQTQMQLKRRQRLSAKFSEFFMEADEDGSGTVSWEEFETHLQDPRVSAYFQALEMDVSTASALFRILDNDGSGEISISEFVEGCMQLKTQAKSLDIKMVMFELNILFGSLKQHIKASGHHQHVLLTSVDQLLRQRSSDDDALPMPRRTSGGSRPKPVSDASAHTH